MRKSIVCVSALLLIAGFTYAQEEASLVVEEMVFCTSIENMQPDGVDSLFTNNLDRVYCFTRVTGAADTTTISHFWYLNDVEKARVQLDVKSNSWRTWSSKRIIKAWTGIWRVDVVSASGELLGSREFIMESSEY